MKKSVLVIFFTHITISSIAQEVRELPIQFHQFFRNYALLNPAASGIEQKLELYLGDKSYTGEFRGVNKLCANFNYALQFDSAGNNKIKHIVGATFYNDKIGSYIGRSRVYASYSMHIPISFSWRLNAGTSFGMVNYYYRASTLFPGNSTVSPSGDVGLWLYGRQWNIGVSANQLFSGNVSPYYSEIRLTRFFNINIDRRLEISPSINMKPSFWLLYVNKNYYDANLALLFLFNDLFSSGISYKYERGYTLFLGLEKISLGSMNLKWMASYYNRFANSNAYEVQSVEISLLFQKGRTSEIQIYEE